MQRASLTGIDIRVIIEMVVPAEIVRRVVLEKNKNRGLSSLIRDASQDGCPLFSGDFFCIETVPRGYSSQLSIAAALTYT